MSAAVRAIPDGYTAPISYLTVKDADKAIDFYKQAFGATEAYRMTDPKGVIVHAELRLGGAPIMLHEEMLEWNSKSPATIGDSGTTTMFYVEDADAVVAKAVAAGATITMPVQTHFYGDRGGNITDPFGHKWMISTHVEDVSPDELKTRMAAMFSGDSAAQS